MRRVEASEPLRRREVVAFLGTALCFAAPGGAKAQTKVFKPVTPIAQPSEMSCWAAAATMLVNWKMGIQFSIDDIVGRAGTRFVAIYKASFADPPLGISPTDEAAFYKALGLRYTQGNNPTIEGWAELLKNNGPLSVTVDAKPGNGFIHALVVHGLDGDGTAEGTIINYVDPDRGRDLDISFASFLKLYEGSASWPLQIIYNP